MTVTLLTQRQVARLEKLSSACKVVGTRDGSPIVERPDGQTILVLPNGRLITTPAKVRSYLSVGD